MTQVADGGFAETAVGSAVPTALWTVGHNSSGGTFKISSAGFAKMTHGGAGYLTERWFMTGVTTTATDLWLQFELTTLDEAYPDFGIRCALDTNGYYMNGFGLQLDIASSDCFMFTAAVNGSQSNQTYPATNPTYVAGHTMGLHMQAVGSTATCSLWDITAGQTEPATPQMSITSTTPPASGLVGIGSNSGSSSEANIPSMTVHGLILSDMINSRPMLAA